MRNIELLLYLKLKHPRNGNKYLLLAIEGPVKFAANKWPSQGKKMIIRKGSWRPRRLPKAAPAGPGQTAPMGRSQNHQEPSILPCPRFVGDPGLGRAWAIIRNCRGLSSSEGFSIWCCKRPVWHLCVCAH